MDLPTIDPNILPHDKDAFKGLPHWRAAHRGIPVTAVGNIPGLPAQGPVVPQAPVMPQQGPVMPQQGPVLPQQGMASLASSETGAHYASVLVMTTIQAASGNNNEGEKDGKGGDEDFDLNTSRPAFWPTEDNSVKLPPAPEDDEKNDEMQEQWRDNGFFLQGEEEYEVDWHGALRLGQGACGRATAWVKLDKDDNILDVSLPIRLVLGDR